tara:strand:+ start:416 stop:859 length:444 start_codon:yes stop_codon:yes gene_type:complete
VQALRCGLAKKLRQIEEVCKVLQSLIGPVASLAGSWLDAKTTKQAAEAKLKLTEAEAKAKILLSEKTSVADWERIMAEGTKSSIKDEVVTFAVLVPVILCFIPGLEQTVKNGFDRLAELPEWYTWLVFTVCTAAVGIRGGKQFFGRK